MHYGVRQLGFASLIMLLSISMGFADAFTYGECDSGKNLPNYIVISFVEPSAMQFHLMGLNPPCNGRILTLEISDLHPLLSKGALTLFAD